MVRGSPKPFFQSLTPQNEMRYFVWFWPTALKRSSATNYHMFLNFLGWRNKIHAHQKRFPSKTINSILPWIQEQVSRTLVAFWCWRVASVGEVVDQALVAHSVCNLIQPDSRTNNQVNNQTKQDKTNSYYGKCSRSRHYIHSHFLTSTCCNFSCQVTRLHAILQ